MLLFAESEFKPHFTVPAQGVQSMDFDQPAIGPNNFPFPEVLFSSFLSLQFLNCTINIISNS